MKKLLTPALVLTASPALAASGPFFSLGNTDFVVLLAFILFVGILVYFKVPGMLTGMLDKRADDISAELDEAKALREEAQSLLASFERQQKEVAEKAERIVAHARTEAEEAAAAAKVELEKSIARRLQAAEEKIASAEAAALREVKDRAVAVAVEVAGEYIASTISASQGDALIDESIKGLGDRLN